MLEFREVELKDKKMIEEYLYKYGENSCQHSFISMYVYNSKYGDMICEKDGFLYILRSNREDSEYRYYLFPMGDTSDKNKIRIAIGNILEDAASHNKKARFHTVTENAMNIIKDTYGDRFIYVDERDLYEYIYLCDKLLKLPGKKFQSKRNIISRLLRDYDGRIEIRLIDPKLDRENIYKLYMDWGDRKLDEEEIDDKIQLEYEKNTLDRAFDNYEELGLRGIVIYIDNKLAAFNYAAPISDTCMDGIVQKADTSYEGIYKLLDREMVRFYAMDKMYFNFEEDCGSPGLRKSKMAYGPDILLKKYIIKEK